jgi:RHS repeat-associated protein
MRERLRRYWTNRGRWKGAPMRKYLLSLLFLILGASWSQFSLAAGEAVIYLEPTPDLEVKVLGGKITIQRTFAENKWHANYNWAPLKVTFDNFDGSVKSVSRGKSEYTKTSPGVFIFQKRNTITQTPTGFRWVDRSGNVIDYDTNGNIQSYSDRNNVKVTFQYETVTTTSRISSIQDHLNRSVIFCEYDASGQLSAIHDYTNRRVQYQYTGGNLTGVIDVNGNSWVYGYTGTLPTTFTDPEGRTITRTWGSNGELASIRYADGTGTDYKHEFDSSKGIYYTQEKSTSGRIAETWLDQNGEFTRRDLNGRTIQTQSIDTAARTRNEIDPRGLKTNREYDQWDNLIKVTNGDGSGSSYSYDPVFSQLTQKTDERAFITKHEYDSKGNLLRQIEAAGRPEQRTTEFVYNAFGMKTSEKKIGSNLTLFDGNIVAVPDATVLFEYDDHGNMTAVVDPEGFRTAWSDFDAAGNPRTKKDAFNKIWTKSYDNRGNVTSNADPLGHSTRNVYDKVGNRTKLVDPLNNETSFVYDARDNLVRTTDPYGFVMRFEYNADNQQTKRVSEGGDTQAFEYDLDGRLVKITQGSGDTIRYVYGDAASGLSNLMVRIVFPTYSQEFKYDNIGRVSEIVDVLDATTRLSTKMSYDAAGNRSSSTDKEGRTTAYEYDAWGHVTKIIDAMLGVTSYLYDNRDNLVAFKSANGQTYRLNYDRRNLKTGEIRPRGQSTTYAYNAVGNLETVVDPKGQVRKYSYDDARRKTTEQHYAAVGQPTPVKTVNYSFNDLNLMTGYDDGVTRGTATYDTFQKRRIAESINYGAFSLGYSYTYRADGLKQSFTGPDGITINYAYDGGDQLSTIKLPIGDLTLSGYTSSAPSQTVLPGGTNRSVSYDALRRISAISVKDPAQNSVVSYQYAYDKVGNVTTKATEHGTYNYAYDGVYRLLNANNPTPLAIETYTYDSVGNRLTDSRVPGAWRYNENNELTSRGNASLDYDANGNLVREGTSDTALLFEYDTNNRLTTIKDQNGVRLSSYVYDPFGRRLWKETAGGRTYFLYSAEGLIAEANNAGAVLRLYGYKPQSKWGTDPVYTKQGGNYYFYQSDHLGTPQKLLATGGEVVWSAKAQAFGETAVDTSTVTNNIRFPGQYFDQESGLHYNWNRYYEPSAGRYLSYDPSTAKAGINRYAYVEMNPLNNYDNEGLFLSPHHYLFGSLGVQPFLPKCPALISVPYMAMAADWYPSWGDSQSIANSCWHAMTPAGGDKSAAEECWRDRINSEMKKCTPRGLGNAMHSLQDAFAGGHKGFQEYDGHINLMHEVHDLIPTPAEAAGAIAVSVAATAAFVSNCKCACFFDICCKDKSGGQ